MAMCMGPAGIIIIETGAHAARGEHAPGNFFLGG